MERKSKRNKGALMSIKDVNDTVSALLRLKAKGVGEIVSTYPALPREVLVALDVAKDGLMRSASYIETSKQLVDGSGERDL